MTVRATEERGARRRPPCRIVPVRSAAELAMAPQLFAACAAGVGVDLGYQDFEQELATLPGKHAPPSGELLLALDDAGEELGCVALRLSGPDAAR